MYSYSCKTCTRKCRTSKETQRYHQLELWTRTQGCSTCNLDSSFKMRSEQNHEHTQLLFICTVNVRFLLNYSKSKLTEQWQRTVNEDIIESLSAERDEKGLLPVRHVQWFTNKAPFSKKLSVNLKDTWFVERGFKKMLIWRTSDPFVQPCCLLLLENLDSSSW